MVGQYEVVRLSGVVREWVAGQTEFLNTGGHLAVRLRNCRKNPWQDFTPHISGLICNAHRNYAARPCMTVAKSE
jgi:hypothetical protein